MSSRSEEIEFLTAMSNALQRINKEFKNEVELPFYQNGPSMKAVDGVVRALGALLPIQGYLVDRELQRQRARPIPPPRLGARVARSRSRTGSSLQRRRRYAARK